MKQVFRATPEFLEDIKNLAGVTIDPSHVLGENEEIPDGCMLVRMKIEKVVCPPQEFQT